MMHLARITVNKCAKTLCLKLGLRSGKRQMRVPAYLPFLLLMRLHTVVEDDDHATLKMDIAESAAALLSANPNSYC